MEFCRRHLFAIAFIAMFAVPSFAENLRNPLPLTRIKLVTELDAPIDKDDPGTGGSFDNSA